MKRQRKVLIILLALICVLFTAFAFGCSDKTTYYTVTFMDGQTQVGEQIKVQKGKKIAEYPTAARSDENYVFDGWYKDEGLEKVWNYDIERVTQDTTLWANFLYVPATPSNVAMDDGAFSNTVTWLQRGINADTDFKVEVVGVDITSGGKEEFSFESYKGHDDIYTVKWTPAQKPIGGVYSVKITSGTADGVTVENLMFKGAGTLQNPYLITSSTDFTAINTQDIAEGSYYKLAQSFTARLSTNPIVGNTFNGVLDGNGKIITLEASDIGLFGSLGEKAEVKDLTVAGAVANVQTDCVGVIAGVNRGKISYCTVSASLDSSVGFVGTLTGDKDGIEGGIAGVAGINYGEISCCTFSGTVKSNVGGAGMAVVNNGTVSLCSVTGTLGAANSNETGNSTKAYSYMGGIVAINYALVEKSSTDGSGKLLAQRGEGGLNDNVGGIVAVNQAGATVKECWFDGIRVHGNKNVGGIAGTNSGTITHCYAGGDYHSGSKSHSYVGGLSEIGGIVGLSDGGTVTNCFVTSNVYAYAGNAYKVAQSSLSCIYLGGNLDNRNDVATVQTDEANGNIKIELNGDYSAKAYPLVLSDEQLAALNGESNAFTDKTSVRLLCEGESTVIEHNITVYVGDNVIGTVSSVSGNKISLKEYLPSEIPTGHYFAGWAVEQDGEVVFEENAQISYSTLEQYGAEQITLYPVFIEGEKPQSAVLNVALWTRYIEEETAKALFEAYKTSPYYKEGYDVVYTVLTSSNNNNYKADYEKGEYNVAFAYKAAAVDAWQISITEIYIYSVSDKAYTTLKVGLNSSDSVVVNFGEFLKSDVAKKIMNPAYVSEAEAEKIEITLISGGTQYGEKLTVSNATEAVKLMLPEIEESEIPAGYSSFLGWAATEAAVEGETLLTGSIGYGDVKSLSLGGTLTLYARFSEEEKAEVVLKVAVYNRYITDRQYANNLISAFSTANSYETEQVAVDFLGESDTNASAFGTLVNDGQYDIVLACGSNIDSASGCNVIIVNKKGITVKGQTKRYIAILTETETAQAFYAFVETDDGKKALNPDYVSEAEAEKIEITLMSGGTQYGEKLTVSNATEAVNISLPTVEEGNFTGWALTEEIIEGETLLKDSKSYSDLITYAADGKLTLYARFAEGEAEVILKVAVYKKFIDQPVADALKTAFAQYCKDNSIKCDSLQIDLITTGNGAAFTADASEYDVAVGHKGGTSFTSLETLTVAMMMNADNGGTVANNRKAERLTDIDIAKTFMAFLQTDEGKAALTATAE